MRHFRHNRYWLTFTLLAAMMANIVAPGLAATCAPVEAKLAASAAQEVPACHMDADQPDCCCETAPAAGPTDPAPHSFGMATDHSCGCTLEAPASENSSEPQSAYSPRFFLAMALLPAAHFTAPVVASPVRSVLRSDSIPHTLLAPATPSRAPPAM